ncbi:MAG TPA: hypothetical protein VLX28_01700, partial [Thermoanaerobaculia bacterium]|nr:hypothetical protein [Thermoanaerobaculia bacterium]
TGSGPSELKHEGTKSTKTHEGIRKWCPGLPTSHIDPDLGRKQPGRTGLFVRLRVLRAFVVRRDKPA